MMLAVDLPSLESIILEAPFHSWAWADTLSLGDMVVWGGREVGKYGHRAPVQPFPLPLPGPS